MNKDLIKLVEKLNKQSGKEYHLELYFGGYGLSLNRVIVAETVKGIKDFCKAQLNKQAE